MRPDRLLSTLSPAVLALALAGCGATPALDDGGADAPVVGGDTATDTPATGADAPAVDAPVVGDTGGACDNPCACAERGPPDFSREASGRASASANADQQAALLRANHWRTAAGLAALNGNAQIDQAASAHASFIAGNAQAMCWPASAHTEANNAGCTGFTGASAGDRLTAAGYQFSSWSEVINWNADPNSAVDGWIWTVYHRLAFMNYRTVDTGFGRASGPFNGRTSFHNVMDFGAPRGAMFTTPARPPVFPLPGQTDVPRQFAGWTEGPTPPAPGGATTWRSGVYSGTVVSMHFPSNTWTVTNHQLFSVSGGCSAVPHTFISKMNDAHLTNDVFLYGDMPLAASSEYVARVEGTLNGAAFARTWAFTTGTR